MIKRRRTTRVIARPKMRPKPSTETTKDGVTQRTRDGRPIEPPTPKYGPAVVICCNCGYTIAAHQVGVNCPYCPKAGRGWNT